MKWWALSRTSAVATVSAHAAEVSIAIRAAVLYLSSAQFPQNPVALVVRTDAQLEAILPAIRAAVREIDPAQPVPDLRRLEEWIAESAAQPRLTTTLAGAFAVAALLLTAVGIYGVISYGVGQRTQEIGVRMAMGAARTSVVGLVLRGGMTWAAGGIAVGLFGAWAVSRAIASLLFDVSAADPLTFVGDRVGIGGSGRAGVYGAGHSRDPHRPDHCVARRLRLRRVYSAFHFSVGSVLQAELDGSYERHVTPFGQCRLKLAVSQ